MNLIDFTSKTFEQLSKQELYQILHLRAEVFVVEQRCPYQDLDELDFDSIHVCGYLDKKLVAYSRLIKPGSKYSGASIGRVITKKFMRNSGAGKALMHKSINECRKQWKEESIFISAQERLKIFYQDLGFVINSESYIEDGIPHIEMKLAKINRIKN
tara:strand:- start:840 stop:1310 length:471 start_codon:yes stop_codon:yes gene_type:complete